MVQGGGTPRGPHERTGGGPFSAGSGGVWAGDIWKFGTRDGAMADVGGFSA